MLRVLDEMLFIQPEGSANISGDWIETDSENLVLEGNTEKVNKLAIDPDTELSDDSQNKNVSNEESD